MWFRGILSLGIGLTLVASGCRTAPQEQAGHAPGARAGEMWSSARTAASPAAASTSRLLGAEAEIAAREYWASVSEGRLQAPNRAHDLRVFFEPTGIRVHDRSAASNELFAATLTGVGRTRTALAGVPAGTLFSERERVEIRREGLVEWYRNTTKGLEQGFDVAAAPAGDGELVVEISFTTAKAVAQGNHLVLRTSSGRRLSYGKLEVRDAKDDVLVARLDVPDPQRVQLIVDDADAAYPIVIDPLLEEIDDAQLEEDQGAASFGFSVAGAGDVNGDGYADVIVGAYRFDSGQTDEGAAFIYHGSSTGIADAAAPAATIQSDVASAYLGVSVAGAGDVDDDGYADVIVGASGYANGQPAEGAAFVFTGSSTGIVANANPSNADAAIESNVVADGFGASVAGAGDVNGDGYDDVIATSPSYSSDIDDLYEGAAFVFLGSSTGIAGGDLLSVADTVLETDQLGASLAAAAGAGDVDGDGYGDVMWGARYYDSTVTNEGAVFVFHGSSTGIASGGPATADGQIASGQTDSLFGSTLAAGDLNGDGFDDVIVGAEAYDLGQSAEGAAFVFYGSSDGITGEDPATADATFQSEQANARFGSSVASGAFAGDAADDLVIGARNYDNGQSNEGAVFLFPGSTGFTGGNLSGAAAQLELDQASANLGISVASAGDIDSDGSDDVIAGANNFDAGQTNEGGAFLFLGDPPFDPIVGASAATTPENESEEESDEGLGLSVVIPTPAGTLPGDLLIAAVYHEIGTQPTPSGWTLLHNSGAPPPLYPESFGIWHRIAPDPVPESFTWTLGPSLGSEDISRSGVMLAARGVRTTFSSEDFVHITHSLYFPSVDAPGADTTIVAIAGAGDAVNDDDLFVMRAPLSIRAKHSAIGPNSAQSRALIVATGLAFGAGPTGDLPFEYLGPDDTHPSGPQSSGEVGRITTIVLEKEE